MNPSAANYQPEPTAVYRCFNADGQLLYVGCSRDTLKRTHGHPWHRQTTTITVEWFPDRYSAMEAEAAAITEERPLLNVQHIPGRHGAATQSGKRMAALWRNRVAS